MGDVVGVYEIGTEVGRSWLIGVIQKLVSIEDLAWEGGGERAISVGA